MSKYDINTKTQLLEKLRSYTETPDDDSIRFKKKIQEKLLSCPELLFVINNPDYESELFNNDGTLNEDGEWDQYFMDNIRPYIYFPETQEKVKNYLCYKVEFGEVPKYNKIEKICQITFMCFCHGRDIDDKITGIPRHDLICSIIREYFNWSNIFGTQCSLINSKEGFTDNDFVTKTLIFECTLPNSLVKTDSNGTTSYINSQIRR